MNPGVAKRRTTITNKKEATGALLLLEMQFFVLINGFRSLIDEEVANEDEHEDDEDEADMSSPSKPLGCYYNYLQDLLLFPLSVSLRSLSLLICSLLLFFFLMFHL